MSTLHTTIFDNIQNEQKTKQKKTKKATPYWYRIRMCICGTTLYIISNDHLYLSI